MNKKPACKTNHTEEVLELVQGCPEFLFMRLSKKKGGRDAA